MKRINDKGLKTLLNLKEDYTLKLKDYKPNDTLKFTEDEAAEEDKVELSPKDSEETPKESEESSEEKPSEEKKDTESNSNSIKYQVNLSNVYSIMRQAKSPADVGLALKAFLKLLQSNSLEMLSAVAS